MKQKKGQLMRRMKIDFDKAKKLLEEKPNLTEEEYSKRFWELWEDDFVYVKIETTEEIER